MDGVRGEKDLGEARQVVREDSKIQVPLASQQLREHP